MKELNQIYAVDFFCGAGGVTCGFSKAGIKVLGGIDMDLSCKETYEKNNKGSKFIHKDISKYSPEELETDLGVKPNDDKMVFIGCSPCQYYTIIHTSKDKSAKSKLLLEDFRKFIDYFRPGFIFIENVPGLDTKQGSPLEYFKSFISQIGYAFDDKVVNATAFNIPQNRKRYVLVASRLASDIKVLIPKRKKIRTVRDSIGKTQSLKPIAAGNKDSTKLQHTSAGLTEINLRRLMKTPLDGGTRLAWKDDNELQLPCYEGKDEMFFDVYGRMHWDMPAPTITTKFYSISNGRFGHPEQNRAISLREGAILQSFPTSYRFYHSSIERIARMIGNAVPPNMAKEIGKLIIKSVDNAPI
ncbi:DNA cytosine methyltransferase [Chitinophaga polysaccharea]|uniref:DNA cytosine methyltransferase n=1 Tax=Chitinophaga polysaccharea TaxID=1293035 RepID=UPI00145537E1|nr:DNA cytosine methyltransferase [Chitinophaga polysaccharea]NLR58908.1 DNA cytosine methyltransferase [Chitinophaga polysaccharea]